jgi:hypothetical protein
MKKLDYLPEEKDFRQGEFEKFVIEIEKKS